MSALPDHLKELWELARTARERAHCPYSGYQVGAALRTRDGLLFSGCNVENASYGATICAERGAIMTAAAEVGRFEIAEILVVTDATPPWPPCGMCRQVIAEFATPDTAVYASNLQGEVMTWKFSDLLPSDFGAANLA